MCIRDRFQDIPLRMPRAIWQVLLSYEDRLKYKEKGKYKYNIKRCSKRYPDDFIERKEEVEQEVDFETIGHGLCLSQ